MDSPAENKFDALMKAMDGLTKTVNTQLTEFRAELNEVKNLANRSPPPAANVSKANTTDAFSTPMSGPANVPPGQADVPLHTKQFGLAPQNPRRLSYLVDPDTGAPVDDTENHRDTDIVEHRPVKANVTVAEDPFKKILKLTDPLEIFEFQMARRKYVRSHDLLRRTEGIGSVFHNLSSYVQERLTSQFADVDTKASIVGMQGRGWLYMTDDFIFQKLYQLSPPRSAALFAGCLVKFMLKHRPLSTVKYDISQANYEDVHGETVRILSKLKLFYQALDLSVNEDSRKKPIWKEPYKFELDGFHKICPVYEAVLEILLPQNGEYLKSCITHTKIRYMNVEELVDRLVKESTGLLDKALGYQEAHAIIATTLKTSADTRHSRETSSALAQHRYSKSDKPKWRSHGHPDRAKADELHHVNEATEESDGEPDESDGDSEDSHELHHVSDQPVSRTKRVDRTPPVCFKACMMVIEHGSYNEALHGAHKCPTAGRSGQSKCTWPHSREDMVKFTLALNKALFGDNKTTQALHALYEDSVLDDAITTMSAS